MASNRRLAYLGPSATIYIHTVVDHNFIIIVVSAIILFSIIGNHFKSLLQRREITRLKELMFKHQELTQAQLNEQLHWEEFPKICLNWMHTGRGAFAAPPPPQINSPDPRI